MKKIIENVVNLPSGCETSKFSASQKTRDLLLSKCGSIDEEIEGLCKFLENAREELQCVKISVVGSRLLEEYNWH